jgi:LacI family kdg operon repressor
MYANKNKQPSSMTRVAGSATIADVAREAGVSKATVSRFLNHRDKLLTKEIALKVEAAIRVLSYSPSHMAQSLKRGRSKLIGLVVADVTSPSSLALMRGAEAACQEAGYMLMPFNLANDERREQEAIETLTAYQVEGFILNTLGRDGCAAAKTVTISRPTVLVETRHHDIQSDFVSLDNAGAVRLCANHLLEVGYRELLFISEPIKTGSSRKERESAFQDFLRNEASENAGLAGSSFESAAGEQLEIDGALRSLRQRAGHRAPAVLTSSSKMTLCVVASLARLGWRLGVDVGLVCFEDTEWSPFVGPGLSAIAQPADELGRIASDCLIERIKGLTLPPRQIYLSGHLVERGSSLLIKI